MMTVDRHLAVCVSDPEVKILRMLGLLNKVYFKFKWLYSLNHMYAELRIPCLRSFVNLLVYFMLIFF